MAITWKCPECESITPESEWREVDLPCDTCGTHPGVVCPACGERFDMVYNDDRIEVAW